MARSKTEDAGGLTPAKDDNDAAHHFIRRTLLILNCVDYIIQLTKSSRMGVKKSSGVPCSYNVGFSVYPGLIPIGIPMLQCAGEELKELRKKALENRTDLMRAVFTMWNDL